METETKQTQEQEMEKRNKSFIQVAYDLINNTTNPKLEKPSDVWTLASKQFRQKKGDYGNSHLNSVCALGALYYYATDGKRNKPTNFETFLYCLGLYHPKQPILKNAQRFENIIHEKIYDLNDKEGMTFLELASLARKYGF